METSTTFGVEDTRTYYFSYDNSRVGLSIRLFKEDWTSYIERLNFYFVANDVTTEVKKRVILLLMCGPSTYELICSLISEPDKLNSTLYEDIVKVVKNHYDPKPCSIMQQHKFNSRIQAPGESIAAYVTTLQQIGDFKDSFNEMLRDRLVCGVNHEQKLMSDKNLTSATALELAQLVEAAEQHAQHLTTSSSSPTHKKFIMLLSLSQ